MVQFNKLEKRGIDQSIRRGLLNQIHHGLDIKFPQDSMSLYTEIQQITSLHALKTIEHRIYHLQTVEELRSLYRNFL